MGNISGVPRSRQHCRLPNHVNRETAMLSRPRPDIIHPAADEEGEHLFDVKPEVVPELFEVNLIPMKKILPITGLATPEVCHLNQSKLK